MVSDTSAIHVPEIHSFPAITARVAEQTAERKPVAALVCPSAPHTVKAFARAVNDELLSPLVITDNPASRDLLAEHGLHIATERFIDVPDANAAVAKAAEMIDSSQIDLLVQGGVRPAPFLTALFDTSHQFRQPGRTISHVAVIKPRKYPKLLFLTDSAVLVAPDLKAKLSLIGNLVSVAAAVGIENPRIAVLAAVEVVYPQMQATLDGAVLAKMCDRRQIKGAFVDGPLSFDIAVDIEAARAKGVTASAVAGQADGMLAPNIEVANGIYNAMTLYGGNEVGGVLVGGRVPVAMHSRADNADARFNSIALSVLMAR